MITPWDLFDPVSASTWDAFVRAHPQGTPFHLSRWLNVLREVYRFRPLHLVELGEDGKLQGVLPGFWVRRGPWGHRYVSIPFSDYGGPLAASPPGAMPLLQSLLNETGKNATFEVRCQLPEGSGFKSSTVFKRHCVDLVKDEEALLLAIDKRTIQYSIRKAQKAGIEVREGVGPGDMAEFIRLNRLTRKKHGVPAQSPLFFEALWDHIILPGDGFILNAHYGGKVVASSIFLTLGKTVYCKYNASEPAILERKLTPNHLITWYGMIRSGQRGFLTFDFGRSATQNEGLNRYKLMWGSRAEDLYYSFHPQVSGAGAVEEDSLPYQTFTRAWKSLPDPITDFLGPRIMRFFA